MPPKVIIWIRSLSTPALVAACILFMLFATILLPVVVGSYVCYKLYYSDMNPVAKYLLIALVVAFSFALETFWVGKLKQQFYPNIPDYY